MRFYKISLPPSQKVTGKLSYRSNLQVRIFLLGGDGDPNHETVLGGVQIFSLTPQYGCHMHLKIFCKVNGYSHSTSQAKKSQRYSITSTSLSGFKQTRGSSASKKKSPWYPPHIPGIHSIEGDILSFADKILPILVRLGEAI